MASIVELILVLLTSFGFNMIPFAGPSNLFIASNAALVLNSTDPTTLVAVGFLVALGAAFAKQTLPCSIRHRQAFEPESTRTHRC